MNDDYCPKATDFWHKFHEVLKAESKYLDFNLANTYQKNSSFRRLFPKNSQKEFNNGYRVHLKCNFDKQNSKNDLAAVDFELPIITTQKDKIHKLHEALSNNFELAKYGKNTKPKKMAIRTNIDLIEQTKGFDEQLPVVKKAIEKADELYEWVNSNHEKLDLIPFK